MCRRICTIAVCWLAAVAMAAAQDGRFGVAVSGTGFFTKDSSGNGVAESASNSGGALASFRYDLGTRSALELNYGLTRNSQFYSTSVPSLAAQQTNIHEFSGDYVFKLAKVWKVRPFVLGGGGALFFKPVINSTSTAGIPGASLQTQGAFLYGAGFDYHWRGRLGVRVQYRGLAYKAPDFFNTAFSTGTWTQAGEPAIGLTWRF